MKTKKMENSLVSKREKADIYYERIISNFGSLKNGYEKFRDGTYLKDWYKEMLDIASKELHLWKQEKGYQIPEESMHIIETLAHIDNFLRVEKAETEEEKRRIYYQKAIYGKDLLPKKDFLRFTDGTYMSGWYQEQKRKVEKLMKRIEASKNLNVSESEFALIQWMSQLHTDLKQLWIDKMLGAQKRERESDIYQKWQNLSIEAGNNPKIIKNKKGWEGIEQFLLLEDFYNGVESRTMSIISKNFPYAEMNPACLIKKR